MVLSKELSVAQSRVSDVGVIWSASDPASKTAETSDRRSAKRETSLAARGGIMFFRMTDPVTKIAGILRLVNP
jgi:hypothetical protein